MASFSIELGSAESLVKLFTYPNRPGSTESLSDTILHWVNQMLCAMVLRRKVAWRACASRGRNSCST